MEARRYGIVYGQRCSHRSESVRLLDTPGASRETASADPIYKFIAMYNETAKPFAWTYDGQPLKVAWPLQLESRVWELLAIGGRGRLRGITSVFRRFTLRVLAHLVRWVLVVSTATEATVALTGVLCCLLFRRLARLVG